MFAQNRTIAVVVFVVVVVVVNLFQFSEWTNNNNNNVRVQRNQLHWISLNINIWFLIWSIYIDSRQSISGQIIYNKIIQWVLLLVAELEGGWKWWEYNMAVSCVVVDNRMLIVDLKIWNCVFWMAAFQVKEDGGLGFVNLWENWP